MNIVLDTNVLVAALRSRNGASYQILVNLAENKFIPNISVPLFAEYQDVLKRSDLLPHMSINDIDVVLDFIASKSNHRKIFYLWRPVLKDPKDDLVLELAVESNSAIVTHNVKDFVGANKFGIQVIKPQHFLSIIQEKKE